jgi:hypothetical protein
MVHLLAAITSFGLLVLSCAFVAHSLRQSGAAILSALVGEPPRQFAQATSSKRLPIRVKTPTRAQPVSPLLQMREAA